ncbi:FAD dependent oxidoreductase [Colletotrichum tofieldiae]|uniref:FAD dependent oxidoreductase n=1 Tax=Colletotrichum tofieldiae TaxID=708197 RepID=A0A166QTP6_9PEZI|nr:FAD dependent oxidoreductase [Colletotrichum tofieldiae]GKT87787.1 FAD dependent oxidoreductase [Colletotrichum tofieldiae]
MKSSLFAALVSGTIAGVAASPMDELFGRQAVCNRDNCFRAVIGSRPGPAVASADCSSWMQVTETPCASTVTETAVVTSFTTTLANAYPGLRKMKREELQGRQVSLTTAAVAASCTPSQNRPSSMPAYIDTACKATIGTLVPTARYSSACSCDGITAAVITVTSTSTVEAAFTPTNTPTAFVLQGSGDRSLYVTVDGNGALRLVRDATAATPFYVDRAGQMRNYNSPDKTLVDYYQPDPATANDRVYSDVQRDGNYPITCRNVGRNAGEYYGGCQSSGSPTGNPVVYGFGYCPNQGGYVYMIPNNSNVRCAGGYAFLGFWLQAYSVNN